MTGHPSARASLRRSTADLHAELDALFSHTDFDNSASYADFLRCQAAPLFAIETAIERSAFADAVPDWDERTRAAAIRHDLASLRAPIPAPAAFADFADEDELLGALYVLEGSRLGAKFLVRSARESRDPSVRAATAYLGHGEARPLWPTFLAMLRHREEHGIDGDALVRGARHAFGSFLRSARRTTLVEPASPGATPA